MVVKWHFTAFPCHLRHQRPSAEGRWCSPTFRESTCSTQKNKLHFNAMIRLKWEQCGLPETQRSSKWNFLKLFLSLDINRLKRYFLSTKSTLFVSKLKVPSKDYARSSSGLHVLHSAPIKSSYIFDTFFLQNGVEYRCEHSWYKMLTRYPTACHPPGVFTSNISCVESQQTMGFSDPQIGRKKNNNFIK